MRIYQAKRMLWKIRHHMAYALFYTYRGRKFMATDVCVPISELAGSKHPPCSAKRYLKVGFSSGIACHVGDGNFLYFSHD